MPAHLLKFTTPANGYLTTSFQTTKAVPKPEKSPPEPSPNIVVQFVSEDDGFALSPAVSLPANVSREDLQSLVNTLTSKVCFIQRFTFHILNTIDIPRPMNPCLSNSMSRYQGMPRLKNPRESWSPSRSRPMCFHTLSHAFSPEDILVVRCSPQSVFRVRPATRCSSSLSGKSRCLEWRLDLPLILPLVTSPGHSSPILCASFSPTGNLLATGSGDANARLWDLFTETPSHILTGHRGWVLCVEWEALERKLATGGHDGHVSYVLPSRYAYERNSPFIRVGPDMGSQDRKAYW